MAEYLIGPIPTKKVDGAKFASTAQLMRAFTHHLSLHLVPSHGQSLTAVELESRVFVSRREPVECHVQ